MKMDVATNQNGVVKDGDEVLRQVDQESRFRKNLTPSWARLVAVISCIFVIYHVLTSRFGMPMIYKHRAIHLGFILALVWIYYPAGKRSPRDRPSFLDLGLIVVSIVVIAFCVFNFDALALRAGRAVNRDYITGFCAILLVLEACRRVSGKALLLLALAFLAYAYFGSYFPGVFWHKGFTLRRVIYQIALTTEGIFGLPLGIAATYLVLFIVFSAFLGQSGLGVLFNDISLALGGRMAGGPAKVAVIASALVGMINGSASTNVATSGAFTIPLMKRVGYKPYFAGAIEAAASTGGQIMPPIMGTGAFIMAEFLGISYGRIAAAAAIPAILYFMAVFFQVDLRARKMQLRGLSREEIPDVRKTLARYGHMFIPIIVLVILLYLQFTPLYAAFYSLVFTWALSLVRKETRMGPKELVDLAVSSSRSCISLSVAMANAGFICGVLAMTGIGLILADNIVALSRGSLAATLVLCMVVSIILGMGLPTSACYVIAASIAVPILINMKVPAIQAHFFVYYFACLSTITPPVALASYVGAGMAGASTNEVGWAGFKLALAGFIIPYFFIYSPAMLLIADSHFDILLSAVTGIIGTLLLAISIEGYCFTFLPAWHRLLVFVSAITLIYPGLVTDVIGFGLGTYAILWARNSARQTLDATLKRGDSPA